MFIHEVDLDETALAQLIRFSEDWTAENSCYGYHPNEKTDIEGNRIFFAEDDGAVVGYLFGKNYLKEDELKILNNLVSGYFDLAEINAIEHKGCCQRSKETKQKK